MSGVSVRAVRVQTVISASCQDVMALISDTRNDPKWCPNVDMATLVSEEPIQAGTKFSFRQHLDRPRGKRVEFDADVEVLELSDRHLKWRVVDRFQTRLITIATEEADRGCKVTQTTEATFHKDPGIAKWLYPLLARRTFKEQFRHLASYLKDSSETR